MTSWTIDLNATRFSHGSNLGARGEMPLQYFIYLTEHSSSSQYPRSIPPSPRYNPNGFSDAKKGATNPYCMNCLPPATAGGVVVSWAAVCHSTSLGRATRLTPAFLIAAYRTSCQLHAAPLQQSACCSYTLPRYNSQHGQRNA
jgi:hypothetical protein